MPEEPKILSPRQGDAVNGEGAFDAAEVKKVNDESEADRLRAMSGDSLPAIQTS